MSSGDSMWCEERRSASRHAIGIASTAAPAAAAAAAAVAAAAVAAVAVAAAGLAPLCRAVLLRGR